MSRVIVGVDPHKKSVSIEAIDEQGRERIPDTEGNRYDAGARRGQSGVHLGCPLRGVDSESGPCSVNRDSPVDRSASGQTKRTSRRRRRGR